MPAHQEVEFKTLDRLTLKGRLYPASRRGPGIILTPGVSPSYFRSAKAVALPSFLLDSLDSEREQRYCGTLAAAVWRNHHFLE
jgi:hypothetical protein